MSDLTTKLQEDFRGLVTAHFSTARELRSVTSAELEAANQRISERLAVFEGELADAYVDIADGVCIFVPELAALEKLAADNGLEESKVLGGITISEYGHVVHADFNSFGIHNIEALRQLTSLTELWIAGNQIKDISALGGLTLLRDLSLSGNQIEDLSALGNLTSLTQLLLEKNLIRDVSALGNLSSLTKLWLNNNKIRDILALENLTELKELLIHGNRLKRASKKLVTNLKSRRVRVV